MPTRVRQPRRVRARRDRNYRNVMRPTRWGNPFPVRPHGPYTRAESVRRYERWLDERLREDPDFLEPLRGYHLGCTCPLELACHVDVLLRRLYGATARRPRRKA